VFVGQGEWGAVDVYLYKFSRLVSWVMTLLCISVLLHSKTFFGNLLQYYFDSLEGATVE